MGKVVKHSRNERVACINRVRTAYIVENSYLIGTITEESNDAGETDWVLRPNYSVIDALYAKYGKVTWIAGIDLDLRLDEYIRTYVPSFVTQRTLPDNRQGLYEELQRVGLTYNDRFEFMCRNNGLCGNNDQLVYRELTPDIKTSVE